MMFLRLLCILFCCFGLKALRVARGAPCYINEMSFGRQSQYRTLNPLHRLDPSSDFVQVPPNLAGFNLFCKGYLLVQHRQYVVVRRPGRYGSNGMWRVVFRCLGHEGCARGQGMEYEAELRDGSVFFGERSDRAHVGAPKKIGGLTVAQ